MIAASSRGARMKVDRGTSSPARTNASSAGTASAPIKQANAMRFKSGRLAERERGVKRDKPEHGGQLKVYRLTQRPQRGRAAGEHQCVFRQRRAAVAPPHSHQALVIVLFVGFPEAFAREHTLEQSRSRVGDE